MNQNQEGIVQVPEKKLTPQDHVTTSLMRRIGSSSGLIIQVVSEERPVVFKGGDLTKVKVDTAWASFTVDGCMLRTETIADRDMLCRWAESGGLTPLAARFTKHGNLPKQAPLAEEPKKSAVFFPRARSNYGKPATYGIPSHLTTSTED